jgi:hypothetical protein
MLVIGLRNGSFTDKRTREVVSYGRIYVTYPFDSPDGKLPEGCEGQKCEELKVSVDALSGVKVGDEIEPVYNRYGRVQDVLVKNKKSA